MSTGFVCLIMFEDDELPVEVTEPDPAAIPDEGTDIGGRPDGGLG